MEITRVPSNIVGIVIRINTIEVLKKILKQEIKLKTVKRMYGFPTYLATYFISYNNACKWLVATNCSGVGVNQSGTSPFPLLLIASVRFEPSIGVLLLLLSPYHIRRTWLPGAIHILTSLFYMGISDAERLNCLSLKRLQIYLDSC